MLPEGQTSAELTPDEKTDDPIADKLVAAGLGFGPTGRLPALINPLGAEARWRGPPPTHLDPLAQAPRRFCLSR